GDQERIEGRVGALHRELREIELGAVHVDVTIIQQREQDGVFQAEAQLAVNNELVHAAGPLDLGRGRRTTEEIACGSPGRSELREGANGAEQQQSKSKFAYEHGGVLIIRSGWLLPDPGARPAGPGKSRRGVRRKRRKQKQAR